MLPLQNTNSGGESTRITLGVLQAVQDGGVVSQRRLASNLGVALGLVNAYVKRCVKKGLLKVRQAPARRYAYYLTPAGLAEKSRLTVDYLSHSLAFFREARKGCADTLESAAQRGWRPPSAPPLPAPRRGDACRGRSDSAPALCAKAPR